MSSAEVNEVSSVDKAELDVNNQMEVEEKAVEIAEDVIDPETSSSDQILVDISQNSSPTSIPKEEDIEQDTLTNPQPSNNQVGERSENEIPALEDTVHTKEKCPETENLHSASSQHFTDSKLDQENLQLEDISDVNAESCSDKMPSAISSPEPIAESVKAAELSLEENQIRPSLSSVSPSGSNRGCATAKVDDSDEIHLHHIKTIQFNEKKVGIVTQNENGPCPLVAIINVLLMRRQISLPMGAEIVSASKLMEHIGNTMLECVPVKLSGEARLNYEQNMSDAMAVLPKLQTGLDVNVKFSGVKEFEYTPECIIFDLLSISLYHGWLIDPQDKEVVHAIGHAGYNQLVEKVISQKSSTDPDAATEALIIENFLERSASQLTYYGLSELNTAMVDDEIGVLFRNNHFSTIYKHQGELFQLVTDQGFLGEPNVVWETLSSIDGDGQFVDSQFRIVPPKPEHCSPKNSAANSPNVPSQLITMTAEQQIDHDYLVALSLQEEQRQQPVSSDESFRDEIPAMTEEDKSTQERLDLELALKLQNEEHQAAEAEVVGREGLSSTAAGSGQSHQSSRSPPHSLQPKNKCVFL